MRARAAAVAETVAVAAVAAWVGGHAALGAFAARILFRDLPRETAATAMTTVFRSFDGVILFGIAALAVATAARLWALGAGRGQFVATLAAVGLLAVGTAELAWVHPAIERMFHEGATLSPAFAGLHRLSERLGHAEVLLAVTLFGAFAWRRGK
jgi:hypothetical protein